MTTNAPWRFWIDRGGTFTDIVAEGPDGETTAKLLSASPAYEDAAVEGMRRLMGVPPGEAFPAERVEAIKMGATVATNALLERNGARTLLVTTMGLSEAVIIGDQARPDLFALDIVRPAPLHEAAIEAIERLGADGSIVTPLDETRLAADLAKAWAAGMDAVAVAFMHADLDPAHEIAAGRLAREAGFTYVALGHEVSPLPRFLSRARTAIADAYLTPPLRRYVRAVREAVGAAPLYFMTSAGALVAADAFRGRDAVTSGPAGGVVGVAESAKAAGAPAVLGFDMGGTSTDVCRYAGTLERRDEANVAGVQLRAPMLDVETVAAGGGSVLHFDGLRARVGPMSAGAMPGPACYGRGGPAAITDAQLVLGRLDPARFPAVFGAEGKSSLDPEASRRAIGALAQQMGVSIEAAAEGFLAVAVEQMAQAIRRVSTERGFDPRDHALVAFGGAAGQAACKVAEALGIAEVLSPIYASLLSAWGIGRSTLCSLRQAGLERGLDASGLAAARVLAERLSAEAGAALAAQGGAPREATVQLGLRYDGADAVLPVALTDLQTASAAFEEAHQRLFGFVEAGRRVVIAWVEARVVGASFETPAARAPQDDELGGLNKPGHAEKAEGRLEARTDTVTGPALIIRPDTQIYVDAGWRAVTEADGLIRLTRLNAAAPAPLTADSPDPVTLELFNRRFMGVAEAMGAALERTAQSVNIKERLDFSCALFDADGGLVANAPHMPVHLGSMGHSVRAVRDRHPELKPGDAFALNNPYAGGTHLPDVTVVMPVFGEGARPQFYVAARGHHADIGGITPGSMPPFSTRIEDEGVMLDALPILREGSFLEAGVLTALAGGTHPARNPGQNIGDLKAQIAACQAGAVQVLAMIDRYGAEGVRRYMGFVQDNARACVRRAIGSLTDGAARLPMDGGGEIAVRVTVDAAAGEAVLDFTESSDQLASNFNAPAAIVDAAALYVFRTLVEDDIPLNAGCLKPLKVITRKGSILDPLPPAAVVAGNVETSQHIVDALYMALGVLAPSQGSMNNFTFGDETRQYYETLCGGAGASARADGAGGVHTHMTNSRLTDPEILERRYPVRVELFGFRQGSGGAGAHRGGDGVVRRIRFLEPLSAGLLSTRRASAPPGLAGGHPALPGAQYLIDAQGRAKTLEGCFSLDVRAGEAIEIQTPGGGGFGILSKAGRKTDDR